MTRFVVVALLTILGLLPTSCRSQAARVMSSSTSSLLSSSGGAEGGRWDAHTHLSMYGPDALDSLALA